MGALVGLSRSMGFQQSFQSTLPHTYQTHKSIFPSSGQAVSGSAFHDLYNKSNTLLDLVTTDLMYQTPKTPSSSSGQAVSGHAFDGLATNLTSEQQAKLSWIAVL